MPEDALITVQQQGPVVVLAVNNPPVNALSLRTMSELEAGLAAAETDPGVKVIVITGAGGKAFCGGADIRELDAARDADSGRTIIERGQSLCSRIAGSHKPVIAAISGVAFGGGLELALACHLRLCSDQARLGQTEINLGIMPGWGGTQRLARLIGPSRALGLILTGDRIDAQEALRIGLVDRLAAPEDVLEEAVALAQRIAAKSGPAVASAIEAVVEGSQGPLDVALRHEADLFVALMGTDDAREGFQAFFDKRPPHFTDS